MTSAQKKIFFVAVLIAALMVWFKDKPQSTKPNPPKQTTTGSSQLVEQPRPVQRVEPKIEPSPYVRNEEVERLALTRSSGPKSLEEAKAILKANPLSEADRKRLQEVDVGYAGPKPKIWGPDQQLTDEEKEYLKNRPKMPGQ